MQNLRIFYTWAPGKPPEQVGKSRKKLQPDPFHCTKRVTASLQMPASSLLLPNLFPILLTPRYSYSPSLTLYPDTCVLRWGKLGTWRSQLFPPTEESSRIPPDPSPHGDRGCVHAESKAEAIQRGAPIYPIQAWVCPSGRPRTSLMPFAHQGQAQWEPHPALPAPPPTLPPRGGAVLPLPQRLPGLSLGSQGCTKSPLSGLETIVLPFMETWAVSHNQAFRGWIKGHGSACVVLGIMELS